MTGIKKKIKNTKKLVAVNKAGHYHHYYNFFYFSSLEFCNKNKNNNCEQEIVRYDDNACCEFFSPDTYTIPLRTVPNSSCTMDYIRYMNLIILTAKSELHVHMTISRIIIKLNKTRISMYLSLSKQV